MLVHVPILTHKYSLEGAYDPWTKKLQDALLELFPLPPGVEIAPETIPEPRIKVIEGPATPSRVVIADEDDSYTATVTANTRITAKDWYQDVRHLELDFDEDLQYVYWFIISYIFNKYIYTKVRPGRHRSHSTRGTRCRRRRLSDLYGLGQHRR